VPNPEYVDIVARGLKHFDLEDGDLQAVAENRETSFITEGVFVMEHEAD
jgi:hypothetical protein